MADEKARDRFSELLTYDGNSQCADCGDTVLSFASITIGIFLCEPCAIIHRELGPSISRIKSLTRDKWAAEDIEVLEKGGNIRANLRYEKHLPLSYRRPVPGCIKLIRDQFIRAKYDREEFTDVAKQEAYRSPLKRGILWKRGKNSNSFQPRHVQLSERDNSLSYYLKDDYKVAKATINVTDLNVSFLTEPSVLERINKDNRASMRDADGEEYRMSTANWRHVMRLSWIADGATRTIFVYANDGRECIEWYNAIRSCKFSWRKIAFPTTPERELAENLTRDMLNEGYLSKAGPRASDSWRSRWFTLDGRRLAYGVDPLDAYPKGEIFLGHTSDGYRVSAGVHRCSVGNRSSSSSSASQNGGGPCEDSHELNGFTLSTPARDFLLLASSPIERNKWIRLLEEIILTLPNPQQNQMAAQLIRKG